jgi:hypothetical protein
VDISCIFRHWPTKGLLDTANRVRILSSSPLTTRGPASANIHRAAAILWAANAKWTYISATLRIVPSRIVSDLPSKAFTSTHATSELLKRLLRVFHKRSPR